MFKLHLRKQKHQLIRQMHKISLDVGVEHNPVSAGERQTITLTASDPLTGNALDKVFLRLTIKDPSGNIIKDYTDNDGKL